MLKCFINIQIFIEFSKRRVLMLKLSSSFFMLAVPAKISMELKKIVEAIK